MYIYKQLDVIIGRQLRRRTQWRQQKQSPLPWDICIRPFHKNNTSYFKLMIANEKID